MTIAGRYFDAQQSAARAATLAIDASGRVVISGADGTELSAALLGDVRISERLGRVPRRLTLPGGAEFETAENDAVDAALAAVGRQPGMVQWLEDRWPVAVGALAAVALIAFLFIRYGVPALANYGARVLPASVDRALGAQGLDVLDRTLLDPSTLPPSRQADLQRLFQRVTAGVEDGHAYRLALRASPRLGPNALALPSGIVIVTDELVELARHDEELLAVLAHEVGHVRGRHSLRQLLQSAGVSAMAFAILGDVSSVSALASGIPVLIEAKHSRDFEREADGFAKQWLRTQRIAESRLDALLCRMQEEAGGADSDDALQFLSTHPATAERANCAPAKAAPAR